MEGTVLMLIVAGIAYAVWARTESRRLGARLLLAYGLLMLVGGYLTAPPWAIFHLDTGAERAHYTAHVVYALCQVPLVAVFARR